LVAGLAASAAAATSSTPATPSSASCVTVVFLLFRGCGRVGRAWSFLAFRLVDDLGSLGSFRFVERELGGRQVVGIHALGHVGHFFGFFEVDGGFFFLVLARWGTAAGTVVRFVT